MQLQRVYVEQDLNAGAEIKLPPPASHYLVRVLRMDAGAQVILFNTRDGEWLAELVAADKRAASLQLVSQTRKQDEAADVWALVAPIKKQRLDYLAQKATEMGVSRLLLPITEHTQNAKLNTERMRANAIEAAEQCGILHIPTIDEPQPLAEVLDLCSERQIIFCDEAAENHTLPDWENITKPPAVLIGPEGGFSPAEREMLYARADTTPLALGGRILRSDTALVAALALVQNYIGDWRK